ncbi:YccS family putative transporter [Pelistega europaea]|nr:YccS family putative transporter [Pelistega europaea]
MTIRTSYITNIPMFISMTLAAIWVWYFHATAESAALFLGIIAGGLVDLDNRLTGRLRNIFFTLIHFSMASIAVQWTYGHSWLFSLLMMFAAFSVTLVGSIDVRYRTIAFGTLLVMLYTVLTYMPNIAWYTNPMMLICGTVLYSTCTIVLHLVFPHRPVQDSVAQSYRKLADYMRVKARFFDPDEAAFLDEKEIRLAMSNTAVINVFNQCRSALFYRLRSQSRHPRTIRMLNYYFAAQNIHERISSRHVEYHEFAQKLEHSDLIFRIQRLIVLQADACQAMSDALMQDKDYIFDEILSRAGKGVRQAFNLYRETHPADKGIPHVQQLIDNVLAISDQIQRLPLIKEESAAYVNSDETRIAGQDVDSIRDIIAAVRSHLTFESSVFRHAVRLSILTAISCLIVEFFHLKMGYWILLTGVIVCQPNYSATTTRLKQRILGTLLGVIVGSTVPYFVPNLPGQLLVVVASATLFFVFRTSRYSFSTFFITIQVLAGFAILGMDTPSALVSRFLDTLIGSALAWCAVSYLWPDWHYLTLSKTARRALSGNAQYLRQVMNQLWGEHSDDVVYRTARRVAHERAVALSNTVSDMSIEPKKYGLRLTDALTLLQLNYTLISSISALGSIRVQVAARKASGEDAEFMQQVKSLAQQIADLMSEMPSVAHMEKLSLLQQTIQAIQPSDAEKDVSKHVLWLQLQRITNRLSLYFETLQHDIDKVNAHSNLGVK